MFLSAKVANEPGFEGGHRGGSGPRRMEFRTAPSDLSDPRRFRVAELDKGLPFRGFTQDRVARSNRLIPSIRSAGGISDPRRTRFGER